MKIMFNFNCLFCTSDELNQPNKLELNIMVLEILILK